MRRIGVFGALLVVLLINARLYSPVSEPADHGQLASHLRFVDRSLDDGLADRMQQHFPEGFFFSHVLYGLTWVELGLQPGADELVQIEALAESRAALAALEAPAGRAPFSENLDPPRGGFYIGWTNYLRAGLIAIQVDGLGVEPDPAELRILEETCDTILAAIDSNDGPFLASYPGQVWPVDTYPAMVSVKACEAFVGESYGAAVDRWLVAVDVALDQQPYGLIGHRLLPFREHPRATSQTMVLRFLAELDPDRSVKAYRRFREEFVVTRLGLPAVREHPRGVDRGGDVDSGPLITGVSASATVVAIGAAQVNGDRKLARAIRQGGEAFGLPVSLPSGRRYLGGVLPIGDLFVLWASSAHLWFQPKPEVVDLGPGWAWRLPTHAASVVAGLGLWWLFWPRRRRCSGP